MLSRNVEDIYIDGHLRDSMLKQVSRSHLFLSLFAMQRRKGRRDEGGITVEFSRWVEARMLWPAWGFM